MPRCPIRDSKAMKEACNRWEDERCSEFYTLFKDDIYKAYTSSDDVEFGEVDFCKAFRDVCIQLMQALNSHSFDFSFIKYRNCIGGGITTEITCGQTQRTRAHVLHQVIAQ